MASFPDFVELGLALDSQGSVVESTEHREWVRVAGHALDLLRWQPSPERFSFSPTGVAGVRAQLRGSQSCDHEMSSS